MVGAMMRETLFPSAWIGLCAVALLSLSGCGLMGRQAPEPEAVDVSGLTSGASSNTGRRHAGRPTVPNKVATRHAVFQPASFDQLPGWQQDNLSEAWTAFRESCRALERKANWKALCQEVRQIKDPVQGRRWLEQEFSVLMVQNTDHSHEGEITGYYEPLLQGQAVRGGAFVVPVYGVPDDLLTFDWKPVPAARRKGVVWVRPTEPGSRTLVLTEAGQPGAMSLDLRRFTLDTLDRRLRVRVQGGEALPYYARADIDRQGGLKAPVLAWVDDPVALYAMQIQGAGRIRMADGSILRLQYADQNGHPFKPMQLSAQGGERVLTRGTTSVDESGDIERFDLADGSVSSMSPVGEGSVSGVATPAASDVDAAEGDDGVVTRGRKKPAAATPASSDALVQSLLQQGQVAKASRASGSGSGVKPGPAPRADAATQALLNQRAQALQQDPSYVFFRVAPEQSSKAGPVGALGVPLSAGRSLAVDPRVMPLGYPVFLSTGQENRRQAPVQRLMFAQDTGGAIRGAVRADYFWGYGAEAGRQARQTKFKGRMWLMVPHGDLAALQTGKLVTRGQGTVGADEAPTCLIADEDATYCDED